jgi:hypothetical protein
MSPVTSSAITIADGEITLDAELLAPQAPPVGQHRALKPARPRQDSVTIARDTNRIAATTLKDNPSETLACRLRAHLQALATWRLPITYREVAKGLKLLPPNTIHQVTEALEQNMAEDAAADRPFIAAMVISKWRGGLPAPGFFDCAARLGRFTGVATGPDARVFHAAEFNAVLALWAPTSHVRESK